MWTAWGASFTLGLLATAAVNRTNWQDSRVWCAFAVGGGVFFAVQFVARPLGVLLASLAGGEGPPSWLVVAVVVVFAEVFKLTAAVVLHHLYRGPRPGGGEVGAAVGAGFGAWSEAVILRSAFQMAQLGLPGGVSVGAVLAASVARLLGAAGSTGLAARLATSGRTLAGLGLAAAAQLVLDPGVRVVAPSPRWTVGLTALVGVGLFAALWASGRRAEERGCR